MWIELIRTFWQICVFKKSPADTPYSTLLLILMAVWFLSLILIQWFFMSKTAVRVNYSDISILGILILLSYMFYTWLLLWVFRNARRFTQTLTALFACHALMHVLALPLLMVIPILSQHDGSYLNFLILILSLMLSIWQFMVSAHIYRHALQIGMVGSLMTSFGLVAVNLLVVSLW